MRKESFRSAAQSRAEAAPEDLRPFSKFTKPYYEYYQDLIEYNGAARDIPDPAKLGLTAPRDLMKIGQSQDRMNTREVDEGAAAFENRYRQHRIGRLAAATKQLGYQLTPVTA